MSGSHTGAYVVSQRVSSAVDEPPSPALITCTVCPVRLRLSSSTWGQTELGLGTQSPNVAESPTATMHVVPLGLRPTR